MQERRADVDDVTPKSVMDLTEKLKQLKHYGKDIIEALVMTQRQQEHKKNDELYYRPRGRAHRGPMHEEKSTWGIGTIATGIARGVKALVGAGK